MKKSVLFFVLLASYSYCQIPSLQWARIYPGNNNYQGSSAAMVMDGDGNLYVTGSTDSAGNYSFCTIKYSASGSEEWVSKFTGPIRVTFPKAIAIDNSGNVYVTGYSNNPGTFFDYCTVKINSTGEQQWVKYYNGPGNAIDESHRVAVDNAGNIYVSGFSALSGGYSFQYATIKYSPGGDELWVRRYGIPDASTYVRGLKIDNSGNIYVTGTNNGNSATLKYDSDGNSLWAANYSGSSGNSSVNDLALDASGNVYVAGYTASTGHRDFFAVKYSTGGDQEWARRFNSDSAVSGSVYEANSVCLDNAGNVFVGGFSIASQSSPRRMCVVKYSNSGDIIWVQKDSMNLSNQTTLLDVDEHNNVYAASSINGSATYMFLKYDNSGNFLFRENYNVTGVNHVSMKVDGNSSVYLTGQSNQKMLTVKYAHTVGNETSTSEIPAEFNLEQNYPNPFNPTTNFEMKIANVGPVSLKIYDMLGKEVAVLVNGEMTAGTHKAVWNAESFPSGIYLAVMNAGGMQFSNKLVLVK